MNMFCLALRFKPAALICLLILIPITGFAWDGPWLLNTTGTTDSYPDVSPQLVVDGSGVIHAIWITAEDIGGAGNDWDLVYAKNSGSGWSDPAVMDTSALTDNAVETFPKLLLDAAGNLVAVWQSDNDYGGTTGNDYDIYYSINNGSGWSPAALVNTNGYTDSMPDEAPFIVLDHSGKIFAAWYSYEDLNGTAGVDGDIFFAVYSGSSWSPPALLNTTGTTDSGTDSFPSLLVDAQGNIHAVWGSNASIGGNTGTDSDIFHSVYTQSSWSAPEMVNGYGSTDDALDQVPCILQDTLGTLHVVWDSMADISGAGTDQDIMHAAKGSTSWSEVHLLNTNGAADTGNDTWPVLCLDGSGAVHCIWSSNEDLNGTAGTDIDLFHAVFAGPGWSAPELLNINGTSDTGYDNTAMVVIDNEGRLYTAWQSSEDLNGTAGTDLDIFYSTYLPPTPTPPPTPTAVWYELIMPDVELHPGETFSLSTYAGNPLNTAVHVDEYIILDVYGNYWFWPGWTQDLDFWPSSLDAHGVWTTPVLSFIWPEDTGSASGLKFWGAFLHQGTVSLITFDMIEWEYIDP